MTTDTDLFSAVVALGESCITGHIVCLSNDEARALWDELPPTLRLAAIARFALNGVIE